MKKIIVVTLVALLCACTPVVKDAPVSNETPIVNAEITTEKEAPDSAQTDIETDLEQSESAAVNPLLMALDSAEGYVELGALNDGTVVYYKNLSVYIKTEVVERIIIQKNDSFYLLCEGSPSKPIIGPNGDTVAYIDYVQFEGKGNLFIYNNPTDSIARLTDFVYGLTPPDTNTVKNCLWLNESELLLIVGFDTGTITQGGDVYRLNIEDRLLSLKYKAKKNEEVVKLFMDQDKIVFEIVYWTDDNLMNYEYKEERYTPDQILGL